MEVAELRTRIGRNKLSPAATVTWDLLASFGIRPAELKGITLRIKGGQLIATVQRERTTIKGMNSHREVPTEPPSN